MYQIVTSFCFIPLIISLLSFCQKIEFNVKHDLLACILICIALIAEGDDYICK
jgi:hypothetical protein